jgi:complex III assembly factor LYRM7
LNASREQIRQGFYQPDESKSVDARIKHLEDVSKFLLSNIVQAKKNETGKYRLNIHEHTELGDNESVKKAKATLQSQGNGCCGGGVGLVQ